MNLKGKAALITGGGTGLGKEIALLLAKEGMNLGIGYSRSEEDALQTVKEAEALGVSAIMLRADLAHTAEANRLVEDFGNALVVSIC